VLSRYCCRMSLSRGLRLPVNAHRAFTGRAIFIGDGERESPPNGR
jgi:hypothetical protein